MNVFNNFNRAFVGATFLHIGMIALPSSSLAVGPYEIVRGQQLPVCRALAENLNALQGEPPMVCERKLHAESKALSLPDWRLLQGESALRAALALKKAQAEKGPPDGAAESHYAKMKATMEDQWSAGRLKAWEANFDLAKSGEKVRVVLVRTGECRIERNFSSGDPIVGVLLPDKFEVDPRYGYFSHADGDVLLHEGTAYIVNWQEQPASTFTDPVGPAKRHKGYVFVRPPGWLPPGQGGGPKALLSNPICQIGYQRLKPMVKQKNQ
jgi:hypothetical protein